MSNVTESGETACEQSHVNRLNINGITTFLLTQFARQSDVERVVEKIHELSRPKVLPYCGSEGYDDCPANVKVGRGLLDIPA